MRSGWRQAPPPAPLHKTRKDGAPGHPTAELATSVLSGIPERDPYVPQDPLRSISLPALRHNAGRGTNRELHFHVLPGSSSAIWPYSAERHQPLWERGGHSPRPRWRPRHDPIQQRDFQISSGAELDRDLVQPPQRKWSNGGRLDGQQ